MRLAHVTQSYPPMVSGVARFVPRLAACQAAAGHTVLVLAASARGPASCQTHGRLTTLRLRAVHNPWRRGQRFVPWAGGAALAALRAFGPEVVHLHDPLAMGLPALWAARKLGCPVVLTWHALPEVLAAYTPPVPGLAALVTRAAWAYARAFAARCQALVAPSPAVAEAVAQHLGCRPRVIPDGVDFELFSPRCGGPNEAHTLRRRFGLAPEVPVIITVGRLDVDKRVEVIVQAAARVMSARPAQLLVVGDGTQRQPLEQLCRRLGIADRVRFAGVVAPQDGLPGLYRLADVFAMASETETLGMVVVEAGGCGLPVVAVRATSMPDLIEHGRTGWLVAPRDPDDMARRLLEVLAQPSQARAMGRAGRARLAPRYGFAQTVAAYEALYGEVRAAGARVLAAAT